MVEWFDSKITPIMILLCTTTTTVRLLYGYLWYLVCMTVWYQGGYTWCIHILDKYLIPDTLCTFRDSHCALQEYKTDSNTGLVNI